jgi:ketosteroid isomerase-like protein
MYKSLKTIFFLAITFFVINSAFAQEWSKEQKEVWSNVEAYWEVSAKGDVDGFLKYFDESYTGWNFQGSTPSNKANTSKYIRWDMSNNKNVLYTITPASIWVNGDFAYVHYYFTTVDKNKEGKETWRGGRWTDILMKKGSKWLLVGDAGGRTMPDDD